MSILIKDMEMPKSCAKCKLFGEYGCPFIGAVGYALTRGERNEDCPLVPVPPHGDLIDRDALSKSLDRLCDRVCQYSKAQRKVMCSACPLGDAFAVVEDDAPTIIEAEEGEG